MTLWLWILTLHSSLEIVVILDVAEFLISVDWASLAKQWIAQREAAEVIHHEQSEVLAQPPPPPPPLPVAAAEPEPHKASQEDENSMDISDDEAEGGPKPSAASNNGEMGGQCWNFEKPHVA